MESLLKYREFDYFKPGENYTYFLHGALRCAKAMDKGWLLVSKDGMMLKGTSVPCVYSNDLRGTRVKLDVNTKQGIKECKGTLNHHLSNPKYIREAWYHVVWDDGCKILYGWNDLNTLKILK